MSIRIIGTIGDCNPLDYGGGIVLDHGDGRPTLVWFEPIPMGRGDPKQAEVYRVTLDRRQVLGDVGQGRDVFTLDHYSNPIPYQLIDRDHATGDFGYAFGGCPYPPSEYTEWWDTRIQDIADNIGQTVEHLREMECSLDPMERAWFYFAIASYYGWHELTCGEVDTERIPELRKRWALRMYQARKRGIQVYS